LNFQRRFAGEIGRTDEGIRRTRKGWLRNMLMFPNEISRAAIFPRIFQDRLSALMNHGRAL
jgi:hypothetical protein